jgi:UDP-N-acetylenolpyruvoylglucosamine reductase
MERETGSEPGTLKNITGIPGDLGKRINQGITESTAYSAKTVVKVAAIVIPWEGKLLKLAKVVLQAKGRASTMAAKKLAEKLGFKVKPGGKHLIVKTKTGQKVVEIPHSLKNPYTAEDIIKNFSKYR